MTIHEAHCILTYIAQKILAPLCDDPRPGSEIFEDLIEEPYNGLVQLITPFIENGA